MKVLLVLIFISLNTYGSCDFKDITGKDKDQVTARQDLMRADSDTEGVRLAWNGMKDMNKLYKIGTVDAVVQKYEQSLCDGMVDEEFKQKYPKAKVKIQKTDFKGYLITCEGECDGVDLEKPFRSGKIQNPKFPVTDEVPEPKTFHLSTAPGNNYVNASVNDRVANIFNDFDPRGDQDVGDFLDKKMRENILKATGASDMESAAKLLASPEFQYTLEGFIEKIRAGGDPKEIPKKYLDLINTMDAYEIPFEASNNFEKELEDALKTDKDGISNIKIKDAKGPFTIARAQGGDDMTLVVKDKNGQIVKIVGADARGLGLMNMTTRLKEFVANVQRGENTNTFQDLLRISGNAISEADKSMFGSMDMYVDVLEYNLNHSGLTDIDQIVREAHDDYLLLGTGTDQEIENNPTLKALKEKVGDVRFNDIKNRLMHMRAGAMNECNASTKTVKDRITTIHNTLKAMEKAGFNGHFGDSCIGIEYWARSLGAKRLRHLSSDEK